jgi:predicted alpha/beta superfamily hydrolase
MRIIRMTGLFIVLSVLFLSSCGGGKAKIKPSEGYSGIYMNEPVKISKSEIKSEYVTPAPQVVICLPKNYETSGKKYPVLYMHDGQNLDRWKVIEDIDELVAAGLMQEIIVVGIYNRENLRAYDYLPAAPALEKIVPNGGLDEYGKFIVEELKPYIDSHYPTLTDAPNTGILGSSFGGVASYNIAGWYPDVFGCAGVMSPIIRINLDDAGTINPTLHFSKNIKMYIDGGWMENSNKWWKMIVSMREAKLWLMKQGLADGKNILYFEDPNGSHNESCWAYRLKSALLYFFGKYDSPVAKIEMHIIPSKVGIGDESTVLAEVIYQNGIHETPYPMKISSDNPSVLSANDKGVIKGLKPGKATLTVMFGSEKKSVVIDVMEKSRDDTTVKIIVKTPVEIKGLTGKIITINEVSAKEKIVFQQDTPTIWSAVVGKKKGDRMVFELVNDSGKNAISMKGELLQKKIIFTANIESEINVKEWK